MLNVVGARRVDQEIAHLRGNLRFEQCEDVDEAVLVKVGVRNRLGIDVAHGRPSRPASPAGSQPILAAAG